MDDKDLVQTFVGSNGRNLSAFNSIVKRYEPIVYRVSLKYLRNTEFAEEVAQEVFIKVYSKLDKLQNPEQLKSWILRITTNTCTDFYRKQKKVRELKEKTLLELSVANELQEGSEDSRLEKLRDVIDDLKEEDRDIIMLHYFSDMRVSEISEEFGLGESAVKMRLHRARDKILKIMSRNGDFKA